MKSRSRRRIKIIALSLGMALLALIALVISYFVLPSRFPVEQYGKDRNGRITFENLHFSSFDADYQLQDFDSYAGPNHKIIALIYGEDAGFVFTTDGMVFALGICESGATPPILETWPWNRPPHEFPYFEKIYNPARL